MNARQKLDRELDAALVLHEEKQQWITWRESIENACRTVALISRDVTVCVFCCYLTYWTAQVALAIITR